MRMCACVCVSMCLCVSVCVIGAYVRVNAARTASVRGSDPVKEKHHLAHERSRDLILQIAGVCVCASNLDFSSVFIQNLQSV